MAGTALEQTAPSRSKKRTASTASVERAAAPGTVIAGKYVLERLLGEGGMGTVWLAENSLLGTKVALKLVLTGLDDQNAAERLLTEARAGARVDHPAIVRVYDFGVTRENEPFIVMEVLEGQTLDDVLEEHYRISPLLAAQILLPVIDGLACMHAQGIVHRDLKPSNIFLDRKAKRIQPKVLDFGIAKVDKADELRKLTRQGTVLGSPAYMSPEQARGLPDIDCRSDLWTLAVVLYESITGAVAFSGDSYNSVLRSVIEEDVVPVKEHGVEDPWLSAILERALQKAPADRFASAREMGVALAEWAVARGVTEDVSGALIQPYWLSERSPARSVQEDATSRGGKPRRTKRARSVRDLEAPLAFVDATEQQLAAALHGNRTGRRGAIVVAGLAGIIAFAASYAIAHGDFEPLRHSAMAAMAGPVAVPALPPAPLAVAPSAPTELLAPAAPSATTLDQVPPAPALATSAVAAKVVTPPHYTPARPFPTPRRGVRPAPYVPAEAVPTSAPPVAAPEATKSLDLLDGLDPPRHAAPATTSDAPVDLKDPY